MAVFVKYADPNHPPLGISGVGTFLLGQKMSKTFIFSCHI